MRNGTLYPIPHPGTLPLRQSFVTLRTPVLLYPIQRTEILSYHALSLDFDFAIADGCILGTASHLWSKEDNPNDGSMGS
ncbi:MAG: hypothetical protein J6S69_03600 [Proteobacteria bacterium]|nr:hypothetical protein [Pseudomonadota bacterium]